MAELTDYYLYRPGATKEDLERAKGFIDEIARLPASTSIPNQWLRVLLNLQGNYFYQTNNLTESQRCFSEAVVSCRKGNDSAALATALYDQGIHLPSGSPERMMLLQECRAISRNNRIGIREYQALTEIITDHFRSDWNKAETELKELSALGMRLGFRHLQYNYNVIAYIYELRSNFVEAVRYGQLSIRCMEDTKDTVLAPLYYLRMAETYDYMERWDAALYWLDRGLKGPLTPESEVLWYKSFLLKALLLAHSKEASQALEFIHEIESRFPPVSDFDRMHLAFTKGYADDHLGDTAKAQFEYRQFLRIAEKFPAPFVHQELPLAYIVVGNFFFRQGDFALARSCLAKTLAVSAPNQTVFVHKQISRLQFSLDSVAGNYLAAIKDHQQYLYWYDSNVGVEQRKKLDELAIQYETVQKDKNIKLLTSESKLKQSKLAQSNLIRNISFAGVGLLLVIMGLLYNQYRLKWRSNLEIQERNGELSRLVDEKEWLLKEVHHRVKNNLQTIVSLLESQSAYLQNDALLAIQDSQNRIYAMSLIHQKLYQTENIASISMASYLPELVSYLRKSNPKQNVLFELEIDDVDLDVSQAIPMGLIVNEAITNSLKYAFTESRGNNVIQVRLHRRSDGRCELTITDNGPGLPANFGSNGTRGLGIRLMEGLTGDIEGQFAIRSEGERPFRSSSSPTNRWAGRQWQFNQTRCIPQYEEKGPHRRRSIYRSQQSADDPGESGLSRARHCPVGEGGHDHPRSGIDGPCPGGYLSKRGVDRH